MSSLVEYALILQWLFMFLLLILIIGILRYLQMIKTRWDESAIAITSYSTGDQVKDFEVTVNEHPTRLTALVERSGKALLLFVTLGCSACGLVLEQLNELLVRNNLRGEATLLLIFIESTEDLAKATLPASLETNCNIIADERRTISGHFGISFAPTAVLLDQKAYVRGQSTNPHVGNWLYKALAVEPPEVQIIRPGTPVLTPNAGPRKWLD